MNSVKSISGEVQTDLGKNSSQKQCLSTGADFPGKRQSHHLWWYCVTWSSGKSDDGLMVGPDDLRVHFQPVQPCLSSASPLSLVCQHSTLLQHMNVWKPRSRNEESCVWSNLIHQAAISMGLSAQCSTGTSGGLPRLKACFRKYFQASGLEEEQMYGGNN